MNTVKKYFSLWIAFSVIVIFAILLIAPHYMHPAFLLDKGALWYYWQLPTSVLAARITGWLFFLSHLFVTIILVYKAQKEPMSDTFGPAHKRLFISQVFFILLHLAQTYFWYDALVKDTPVWLSQFSVIIMLVLMLLILNRKRGLFFGFKIPFSESIYKAAIGFHGYFIILATIFTFWYHPMESTVGHLIGFFYMFLLLGQIVFSNTEVHFNRYWVFILEVTVLIHGTAIAIQSPSIPSEVPGKIMWPMFAFGFGAIAVITQIYSLKLSKWVQALTQLVYLVAVFLVYSGALFGVRTFSRVYEISFIPFIEYLLVFVFAAVAWGWMKTRGIASGAGMYVRKQLKNN